MKRLSRIEIYNFKNIKRAKLDFKNSMLGLYGQNGSGKTALIDVLDLVKTILCGQKSFIGFFKYDSCRCRVF